MKIDKYSDHNSILINLDFEAPTEEERPKKIITKKDIKDTEQSLKKKM